MTATIPFSQRVRVAGIDEDAGDPVGDDLGQPADARGDDRARAQRGLQRDEAEALQARRDEHGRGPRDQRPHRVGRDPAGELDPVGDAALGRARSRSARSEPSPAMTSLASGTCASASTARSKPLSNTTRPEARNTGRPRGRRAGGVAFAGSSPLRTTDARPAIDGTSCSTSARADREHAVTRAASSKTRASALRGSRVICGQLPCTLTIVRASPSTERLT